MSDRQASRTVRQNGGELGGRGRIEALEHRLHERVERGALAGTSPPYHATVQIKAGMVPVNLIHEIEGVGFDYGMTPREVADAVVEGHVVVREREVNLSAGAR